MLDTDMKKYRFSVVVEKDEGGYFAFCPELQGCYTQGNTYEEAIGNIKDATRLHIEDRVESKEAVKRAENISLTSLHAVACKAKIRRFSLIEVEV